MKHLVFALAMLAMAANSCGAQTAGRAVDSADIDALVRSIGRSAVVAMAPTFDRAALVMAASDLRLRSMVVLGALPAEAMGAILSLTQGLDEVGIISAYLEADPDCRRRDRRMAASRCFTRLEPAYTRLGLPPVIVERSGEPADFLSPALQEVIRRAGIAAAALHQTPNAASARTK